MSQRITQIAAGLLLLLMPGTLCAQFAGPNVPMVASGQMPSAVPGNEARRSNIFSASFAAGAHYDDNAFGSSKGKRSDIDYYFRPNFAVVQTFRRLVYAHVRRAFCVAVVETQRLFNDAKLYPQHRSVPAIWFAAIYDGAGARGCSESVRISLQCAPDVEHLAGAVFLPTEPAHDGGFKRKLRPEPLRQHVKFSDECDAAWFSGRFWTSLRLPANKPAKPIRGSVQRRGAEIPAGKRANHDT